MKRNLATLPSFLLVAFLTLGLLAGCTNSQPKSETLPASNQAPAPAAEQPKEPAKEPAKAPVEVVVGTAVSLTNAVKEAQTAFEATNSDVKLVFNFASSGSLQQQIEQGAPIDLFLSAATGPVDALVTKGLVEESAVKVFATNQVVLIRHAEKTDLTDWAGLAQVKQLAMANPAHAPVGQYGQATLEKLNLWDGLQGKLVFGEDVRQVVNFVESGAAEAGIVYSTDAAAEPKVVVVAAAPAGSHAPVNYPLAVVKESKQAEAAQRFASFLQSDQGVEILAKHGFGPGQ